jgi:hypothetical protein
MDGLDFFKRLVLLAVEFLHSEGNEWGGYTANGIRKIMQEATEEAIELLDSHEA